ncbi:MAG: glutaredoxin domain-containing protein [Desulfotomaculaceae bacterium]|nr:glutaredoxin domain-containing protein [Desulfotomaculaceae bacterium]
MKDVIMFTTKTCSHCKTAKKFLSQNKIHFIEKDINVDEQARSELISRNVRGVPAFLIGDDLVVGFDPAKIQQLVDHRLVECEECHTKLRVPINKGSLKVTCPKCKHAFEVTPR